MAQIDALRFGESWQLANLGLATLGNRISEKQRAKNIVTI